MAEAQHPVSPTPKKRGRQRRDGSRRPKSQRAEHAGTEGTEGEGSGAVSGDEDSLFDLLGIASPPTEEGPTNGVRGILAVSKADIDGGNGKLSEKKGRGGRPRVEAMHSEPEGFLTHLREGKAMGEEKDGNSEGETRRRRQPRKGKGKAAIDNGVSSVQPVSALTATRPRSTKQNRSIAPAPDSGNDEAFETASLSQSLPSGGLFSAGNAKAGPINGNVKGKGKRKGKKPSEGGPDGDESAVWEMPEIPGPTANQAMTVGCYSHFKLSADEQWQQKLQTSTSTSDSPRRPAKSSTPHSNSPVPFNNTPNRSGADHKPRTRGAMAAAKQSHPPSAMHGSPMDPRPVQARRLSLDNLPVSAFDHTQPFHTGFNVHRAPQTPAKLPGNMAPSNALPTLQGDFPRIGKGAQPQAALPPHFQQPPSQQAQQIPHSLSTPGVKGFKYAGPTFHNSPHAASLPKPDLDDF